MQEGAQVCDKRVTSGVENHEVKLTRFVHLKQIFAEILLQVEITCVYQNEWINNRENSDGYVINMTPVTYPQLDRQFKFSKC